jgi:hypothetical protein
MTESRSNDPIDELPWPDAPLPRTEVRDAIRQHCTENLSPARGWSATTRVLVSVALSATVVGVLAYLSRERSDVTFRAALFGAAGWAIVQAMVLVVGLSKPPGQRVSRRSRLLLAACVPVAFLAYLAFAASQRLPLGSFFIGGHAGGALGCGLHALLFGAIAAAGTLFVWRRTDPITPGVSGMLAGLVGGLAGASAIGVACPSGETWHLWVGHGATILVLGGLGFIAGRRWLSP